MRSYTFVGLLCLLAGAVSALPASADVVELDARCDDDEPSVKVREASPIAVGRVYRY